MFEIKGKYSTAKVMIDSVEEACVAKIHSFLNHPAFTNPIAIMPDCHDGKGSVIGFTMPMTDKVVPNVIGVDIGCGMSSIDIGTSLPLSLQEIDHKIRQRVPFGFDTHEKPIIELKEFPWKKVNVLAQKFALAYQEKFNTSIELPKFDTDWFIKKCSTIGCDIGRAVKSLGTFGGGNHFAELGISTKDHYWFTVHTGSRNFGKCICEYWQDIAIKKVKKQSKVDTQLQVKELKEKFTGKELYEKIKAFKQMTPEPIFPCSDELRWLEGDNGKTYLFDMIFSQVYAEVNRSLIIETVIKILGIEPLESIETVHNFIDFSDFIIRKGSIRSYEGSSMIIPFNMRDGILICTGKSNPEWNYSAPHGAGRVMSRAQAKKNIELSTFKDQMKDVFSTSVNQNTLDEAPDAYKDAKIIEEAIAPTATIIDRIKPLLNMKDSCGKE